MGNFILLEEVKSIAFPILQPGIVFSEILFLSSITEWNKLDRDIRNSDSLNIFRFPLLHLLGSREIRSLCHSYGIKLVTRLRLGMSYLHNH